MPVANARSRSPLHPVHFRIRSCGFAAMVAGGLAQGQSDLYGVVQMDVPTHLTEPERALYQDLARISDFKPRPAFA